MDLDTDLKISSSIEITSELDRKERVLRYKIVRLAQEFLVDFSIIQAAHRAGIGKTEAIRMQDTPLFCTAVQETILMMHPDVIMTRNEVLLALKKEAFNYGPDASSNSRITALKELAQLMGMDPKVNAPAAVGPVINLTITSPTSPQLKLTQNATPEPSAPREADISLLL